LAITIGDGTDLDISSFAFTGAAWVNSAGTTTAFNGFDDGGDSITITGDGNNTIVGSSIKDLIDGVEGANSITGGQGADNVTGGAGVDTFVFATGDSGQTAATADVVNEYTSAADIIDYTAANGTAVALTLVAEGASTSATQAAIGSTGLVTFHSDDDTLTEQIAAVEAGMTAATAVAGETAIFADVADNANSYIFISDGTAGLGAGDVLIHIIGDAAGALTLAGGNITEIA
jgi:Ca2+-binding RTX toxin-like protein